MCGIPHHLEKGTYFKFCLIHFTKAAQGQPRAQPKRSESSSNSGSIEDDDGRYVDENGMCSDDDDVDDDSDNPNNLLVPTMFCKPVLIEGKSLKNLSNDDSDSHSALNSDELSDPKRLGSDTCTSDSSELINGKV